MCNIHDIHVNVENDGTMNVFMAFWNRQTRTLDSEMPYSGSKVQTGCGRKIHVLPV